VPRKRTWTDEQFIEAVRNGRSVRGVLQALGLNPTGANYKTVHHAVAPLNLDTSHWRGQGYLKGLTHNFSRRIPMEEILVENSTFHNLAHLKVRLVRDRLMEKRCSICGLTDWRGQPLSLVLDHVNGVNNDHRLENLRFLCPNCNSQQETFAGRNKRLRYRNALALKPRDEVGEPETAEIKAVA
jgi:Zn finger protein HypA/HybF involved in hydrogenase expression